MVKPFSRSANGKVDFATLRVASAALLKALITHAGAVKAAEFYLAALESTAGTDHLLRGLYKQAGLSEEYVDPMKMIQKLGGLSREEYKQHKATNREAVLKVLTADFKRAETRFKNESEAYSEMLRSSFR